MPADYTVKLVEQDGAGGFNVLATMNKPVFNGPPTKQLNGIGSCGLQISPNDPDHAAFYSALQSGWLSREVQIFRGAATDPFWWGVPIRPAKGFGSDARSITCAEIPWLLTKRFFGKTSRTNYLLNPEFESGLTSWTAVAASASSDTTEHILGTKSLKLVEGSAGADAFEGQGVTFTAVGIGNVISFAAWFKIDDTAWIGPAYEDRGLFAERVSGGVVQQVSVFKIDDKTPRGVWIRAEIPLGKSLWVPPNATETINVRLYAPGGTIWWDAVFMGVMESFGSAVPGGSDLATLAAGIVGHAQDPAYNKDDLDIGTSTPATGRNIDIHWQFAEHANIWNNGLQDLVAREDGIDLGWEYQANARTMHTYSRVGSATGKGADLTSLDMSLFHPQTNPAGLVLDYAFSKEGGQAANALTVLGDGDGPDREEGGYLDLTKLGGRTFEAVVAAPTGSPIDSLNDRAGKLGRVRSYPLALDIQLKPGGLLSGGTIIAEGDRVTIPAYDADITAGTYRVMDMSYNTASDVLTLGVNYLP